MKAIILAAGRGNRLSPFTDDRPKCLLEVAGRSVLDWQVRTLASCGITEIIIVKGYRGNMIVHEGAREYWNLEYETSNMVASLFCAEEELCGELLVIYADILFETRLLRALVDAPTQDDIVVPVDIEWENYYTMRFGSPLEEAESLTFDSSRRIVRIGDESPQVKEIQGRFIGLLRLSSRGATKFREFFEKERPRGWDHSWMRGRSLKMAYMTDFIQALIDDGTMVVALPVRKGWVELDSGADYVNVLKWHENGNLVEIFRFDS